jgi:hypothetical protein
MPHFDKKKKILFVCGSINQTTQMHQISKELPEYEHAFTSYYGNLDFDFLKKVGALEATIGGNKLSRRCLDYLEKHRLPIDYKGSQGFDLAFQCSDLVRPNNLNPSNMILVQEGMTDPPSVFYPIYQRMKIGGQRLLPGWLAGTSTFGLSGQYGLLCAASQGYKDEFERRGADRSRIVVTGIPNFDDCDRYRNNKFPFKNYMLCCTSDTREVFWFEDRKGFIDRAVKIANGRQIIFKLHPNEKVDRATREIERWAPGSLVYTSGSAEEMVANCDILMCSYSSVAYVGTALGKEVYSFYPNEELKRLLPLQNKSGAKNIADVAREFLGDIPKGEAERRIAERAAAQAALRAPAPPTELPRHIDHRHDDGPRSRPSRPEVAA